MNGAKFDSSGNASLALGVMLSHASRVTLRASAASKLIASFCASARGTGTPSVSMSGSAAMSTCTQHWRKTAKMVAIA